ncbi:hypothetical protein [Halobellus rarus]|uniref:Uncharacterized protein n=1 Tax=Halobellus rarus TaxID=1126237 RepID=A0ABD6CPM7_9EURY|nr:hypothetical protein [Halobellus rarus]
MQPHSSFDALSRVIERLGADGRTVRRAEAAASADEVGNGSLRATVEVAIPFCEAASSEAAPAPEAASVSAADGTLDLTVQLPVFPDASADDTRETPSDETTVSAHPTDAEFDDGTLLVTVDVVIDADPGTDARAENRTTAPDAAAPGDQPVDDGSGDSTGSRGTAPVADDVGRSDSATPSTFGDTAGTASDLTGRPVGSTGTDSTSADDGSDDADPLATVRDESVPPYEDTPYLRRLYESCDTFEEMSQRIEMDVSDETVRRYMIEAEVHSPTSYETRSETVEPTGGEQSSPVSGDLSADHSSSDASSERGGDDPRIDPLPDDQLVADGIGFPDRLTLHDVVDAVADARTVHEVGRELGLEHDRTRRLLRQLNVLDLVLRRVSDDSTRELSVEDVAARIRQSAPDAS